MTPAPGLCSVVLLSGGIDSATTLAIAQAEGHTVYALSFDYGQRHHHELVAAGDVAAVAGVADHRHIRVDLGPIAGSALTDPAIPVPRDQLGAAGIPATYVPARNTIFLSYALAYAETVGARHIWVGCNADDHAGYPDCRSAYLAAFEQMAGHATTLGDVRIHAPLVNLTKAQVIRRGLDLGVDYSLTWSCYAPTVTGWPCRHCDACHLRAAAFAAAGVPDPAPVE